MTVVSEPDRAGAVSVGPGVELATPPVAADGPRRTGTDGALSGGAPKGRLALGLALVAAMVLAVVLGRQAFDQRAATQDRSAVLAAARQIAVNFSTLDYRTFDRDTARVTAAATGAFRSDFTAQAAQIKDVVVTDKSVSVGQVGQAAIVSLSGGRARVLLALDAQVTNTSTATPAARHYRVQLDLTRVHGHWLANQLQFVG